jgi:hypothetical protein
MALVLDVAGLPHSVLSGEAASVAAASLQLQLACRFAPLPGAAGAPRDVGATLLSPTLVRCATPPLAAIAGAGVDVSAGARVALSLVLLDRSPAPAASRRGAAASTALATPALLASPPLVVLYRELATLTAVSPSGGSEVGGTRVRIRGRGIPALPGLRCVWGGALLRRTETPARWLAPHLIE